MRNPEKTKRENHAFVSFYAENRISPVAQDLSDLRRHFQRRESLFRSLGILPLIVKGASVIEFGPGSGHNALYTASLKPATYTLVEGNPIGVQQTREMLARHQCEGCRVVHSMFLDYATAERFDIVWAEGCIPHQAQPLSILDHLSQFTKPSGLFVCTTSNAVSYLSETIRRLVLDAALPAGYDSLEQGLRMLRPLLSSHLLHLKGMSRSIDDWIVDSILQPLQDRALMSIPNVIAALHHDYDVYASCPRFIADWRWYKEIIGENRGFNEIALAAYYRNNLNLMDYRFVFKEHAESFGRELESRCADSWDVMCKIQSGDTAKWQEMFDLLRDIAALIESVAPETAMAIREASQWLQDGAPATRTLNRFPQWWGRGQQYLGMIRKPP